jgi:hypothetical protein
MSFSEFLSEVKTGGLARNNRFTVSFDGGELIGAITGNDYRKLLLFCDGAQLPGQSLATVPNRTFGEIRETPYDRLYEPVTLSFYCDTQMQVKYYFDNWMDQIYNPATRKFAYYDDYICNLTIDAKDTQNNTQYRVTMFEAYPKSVSAVQMDAANKDVMKVNVTFQYKSWTSKPLEVYYRGAGDPISASTIFESYSNYFPDFQSAWNGYADNNRFGATGGLPGFDGLLPDTQGFLTSASQRLTDFTRGGLSGMTGGRLPSLSNIMNLKF